MLENAVNNPGIKESDVPNMQGKIKGFPHYNPSKGENYAGFGISLLAASALMFACCYDTPSRLLGMVFTAVGAAALHLNYKNEKGM